MTDNRTSFKNMKQVDNYVAMRVVEKGILELMQSVQIRGRNAENARKKDILRYAVKLTRKKTDNGDDLQQLEVLNQTVTMVMKMMMCTCLQ